jgi:hypothetical protein
VVAELVKIRRLTDQEGQQLQRIVRRGSTNTVRYRRAMMLLASVLLAQMVGPVAVEVAVGEQCAEFRDGFGAGAPTGRRRVRPTNSLPGGRSA